MLVLRCTTKAFRKLGAKPKAVTVSVSTPDLGEWYVNTIDYLNGGDLMMACMHVRSLFVVMVPLSPDMDASGFAQSFLANLVERLLAIETPPDAVRQIIAGYEGTAVLAKNADRKVAGHLNSALTNLDFLLDHPHLGLADGNHIHIPRIEHCLNDTPRGVSSSGRNCIWPLLAFWESVRSTIPDLPARTFLPDTQLREFDLADCRLAMLRVLENQLVDKVIAAAQDQTVLFSADELQTLVNVSASDEHLTASIPGFAAELHAIAAFRLERLLAEEDG